MVLEEGRAQITGHEEKDNFIIIKGRYSKGSAPPVDFWVKYDKASQKIVDYGPK